MEITHAMVLSPCLLAKLTAEQKVDLVLYIFSQANSAELLRMMYRVGTFELVFPGRLRGLWDMDQGAEHHKLSAFDHCAECAAVLEGLLVGDGDTEGVGGVIGFWHDAGKIETRAMTPEGKVTFHGHAEAGAALFAEWAAPLSEAFAAKGVDVKVAEAVIRHHMYFVAWCNGTPMTDKAILRMVAELGEANLPLLFALRQADWATSSRDMDTKEAQERAYHDILRAVAGAREKAAAEAAKVRLAVSGKDVADKVGGPGPKVGETMKKLTAMVESGQVPNDREALLAAI